MESPNLITTESAQESPIFSYISNLSPIQPVKAPAVTQGFPGLSPPPLVFTSPQLNLRSQPTYLKRARVLGLSTPQSSRCDVACKESVEGATGSLNLDSQLTAKQITCSYKLSEVNAAAKDQSENPPQCQESQDQLLTDLMNTGFVDSTNLSDSVIKTSECVDQPPDELATKADHGHDKTIDEGIVIGSTTSTKHIKDVRDKDSTIDGTQIDINNKHTDGISDHCTQSAPQLSVGHALINQEQKEPLNEEGRASLDQSPHFLSGSMQIDVENDISAEVVGAVIAEPSPKEAFQRCGVRRRCLQFEDARYQAIINHPAPNPEGTQYNEKTQTLVHEKQAVMMQSTSYPRKTLGSTILVNKPIGLHLNKIFNSKQTWSCALSNNNVAQMSKFYIHGQKLISMINSPSDNSTRSSVLPLAMTGLSKAGDIHVTEADISDGTLSMCTIKPSNPQNSVEEATSSNKRKCNNMTDADLSDNFNQSSAKKKIKKSSESAEGDGCKSCSCKKSNCLKLYCDCFAAGQYCSGSCACQACLNRPKYEETVLDKKHQIESRNPLAFAPKVIQHSNVLSTSNFEDEQAYFTPSSARHKRGCNCKKSMCVKKYCECYQANVGCTNGCRCDGCQNVFGRKDEYSMVENLQHDEDTDGSLVEKFEHLTPRDGLYQSELHNSHKLTPTNPAFQFSNHREDASEAWSHSGKHFQTPDSSVMFARQFVMSSQSPSSIDGNANILESANDILDLVSFERELDCGNAETVGDFSAEKMDLLSGIPNPQDWAENTNSQPFPIKEHYSLPSPLHWHGSPNTSVVLHTGTKILPVSMQDDTTDIMEDAPASINTVKVISPSKKRVSPPHRQVQLGSSSSNAVRTGRKFILKAVPSFPPLTPCIKSKIATGLPTEDHQKQ